MQLFRSSFKRTISTVLSATMLFSSIVPVAARAQTVSCDANSALTGTNPSCVGVTVGTSTVVYPKMAWSRLSEIALGSSNSQASSLADPLVTRSAQVLGLTASQYANAAQTVPTNVPYVVARYNPLTSTLRIDVFKLEKTYSGGNQNVGLYQAVFGPAQGGYWAGARSYISPDQYKLGSVPGLNPFSSFQNAGDDLFHNISLSAAQVAIGHAMRLVGSPYALLSVAQPRIDSRQETSSDWFTSTTKVWVYGYAKPMWFMAQPTTTLNNSATMSTASFCAGNPTISGDGQCPWYQTAAAGVSFEQIQGGTLAEFEDRILLDYKENSGLSFLGAVVIGVIGSFATAGLLASAGFSAAGTMAVGSEAAASAMGSMGTFLVGSGVIDATATLGAAIALEAGTTVVGLAVLGGANLSSTFDANAGALIGFPSVQQGSQAPQSLSGYQGKLNNQLVDPGVSATLAPGSTLGAVTATVLGGCAASSLASQCSSNGVINRPDQVQSQDVYHFVRDNSGNLLR